MGNKLFRLYDVSENEALFFMQKIKRPNVLQEARNQTQKRSELTAMLLRESRKLEQEEGRQQVATKVEKSPFNAVNSSPWNSQTYEGQ